VGISYKITCDRCGAQYPEEIDSEIYEGSSFGMSSNDVALKIRDNNWFITIDDKVLCSVCDVRKDFDADEVDDDSTAWHRKGIVLDNLGRYEEALQVYDKALELKPNDFDAWHRKGGTLDKLGRYEEALLAIDKALKLKPDVSNAWHRKGGTLVKLGRYRRPPRGDWRQVVCPLCAHLLQSVLY
jgi:tetratricopeptide (TPR) repeat protein